MGLLKLLKTDIQKLTSTYQCNTWNMYVGQAKLFPAGYYKYEIYEVSWVGTVTVSLGNAPATENDVLSPSADTKGVVQGISYKG